MVPLPPKGRLTDTEISRSGLPVFAFIKIKFAYGSGGSPRKAGGYRGSLGKGEMGNGKRDKGLGSREEASGADKIENLKLKVEN